MCMVDWLFMDLQLNLAHELVELGDTWVFFGRS